MLRKTLFLAIAAILVVLAMSSETQAWYAYHYHTGYGGVIKESAKDSRT